MFPVCTGTMGRMVRPGVVGRWLGLGMIVVAVGVAPARAGEESSKSAAVAQALVKHLEGAKQQYIAVRDPNEANRYVAAMFFPGLQLLVISAQYSAPALMNEKLYQGKFQDVYVDLHSASVRGSRIMIEDLLADGLARAKGRNRPPDSFESDGKRVVFDFDWRKQKLSEDEYFKALDRADEQYSRMLGLLLAATKKPQ
jgi:hypothetical protein